MLLWPLAGSAAHSSEMQVITWVCCKDLNASPLQLLIERLGCHDEIDLGGPIHVHVARHPCKCRVAYVSMLVLAASSAHDEANVYQAMHITHPGVASGGGLQAWCIGRPAWQPGHRPTG